jgi:hypothetical protein
LIAAALRPENNRNGRNGSKGGSLRKGKERKGKERKGKERKGVDSRLCRFFRMTRFIKQVLHACMKAFMMNRLLYWPRINLTS